MQLNLVTAEHGFRDFDVFGVPKVHRACVPRTIKRGQPFNVYCEGGVKLGAEWRGSLTASLARMTQEHPIYRELVS